MASFDFVMANREHFVAIGQTDIYLERDDGTLPWEHITRVETGSSYRFNGPTSIRLIAEHEGLSFKWNFDLEERSVSGTGTHRINRSRFREMVRKVPLRIRSELAALLRTEYEPHMVKLADEIRDSLQREEDDLDCLRGIIRVCEELATES